MKYILDTASVDPRLATSRFGARQDPFAFMVMGLGNQLDATGAAS